MSTFLGRKFKTYAYDSAPFFFYFDVLEADVSSIEVDYYQKLLKSINKNPIMPIPMRIDRAFNGENSVIIRPQKHIKINISKNEDLIVNPTSLIHFGVEKLLNHAEIRASGAIGTSIKEERTMEWWNLTKRLYGEFFQLERDFTNFMEFYLDTVLRSSLEDNNIHESSLKYCQLVADVCEKRINENSITVKENGVLKEKPLYKTNKITLRKWFKRETKQEIHPELFPVELYKLNNEYIAGKDFDDLKLEKFHPIKLKYIPLLIYDDLLECMLSNLSVLEENEDLNLIDPSFLIKNNIVIRKNSKELENLDKKFSWLTIFDDVEIKPIILTIKEKVKKWILENPQKYY